MWDRKVSGKMFRRQERRKREGIKGGKYGDERV